MINHQFYLRSILALALLLLGLLVVPSHATAQETVDSPQPWIFGFKVRAGGRYDNVRMCVGSPPGVKGGPAMDISLFTEIPLDDNISLDVDLPFMRPILFGVAFNMLQFEPSVTLKFRNPGDGNVDFVAGPTLGLSFHYGPDYNSEQSGDKRTESFFALGPTLGGFVGVDFKRPGEHFNFQLGLTPYVTGLFSVNDPENHKGIVVGGLLDGIFRFRS